MNDFIKKTLVKLGGNCNNPTNNTKGAALHAECQAIARVRSGIKGLADSILPALLTRGNDKRTQIKFLAGPCSLK